MKLFSAELLHGALHVV